MFNDSGNFYYSPNGDITNSQQRLHELNQTYSWKQVFIYLFVCLIFACWAVADSKLF